MEGWGKGWRAESGSVGEAPTKIRAASPEMEAGRQDMRWGDCGSSGSGGRGATHGLTGAPASPAVNGRAGGPFRTDRLSLRWGRIPVRSHTCTCSHTRAHADMHTHSCGPEEPPLSWDHSRGAGRGLTPASPSNHSQQALHPGGGPGTPHPCCPAKKATLPQPAQDSHTLGRATGEVSGLRPRNN